MFSLCMQVPRARSVAGGLLASALALTAADAVAGAPELPSEPPFENLSETWQARSTYIFRFDESVPAGRIPARAAALTRAAGGELRHTYTTALNGFAATMPSVAMLRLLERSNDIVSVERDSVDHILARPGACEEGHPSCKDGGGDGGGDPPPGLTCDGSPGATEVPWGIARVGASALLGSAPCGQGVHVYVIDTGIDLSHGDLAPVGASVDCTRGPNCEKGGDGSDDNGHGTHVAGTIAARMNGADVVGVAPAATLHAVKVLRSSGLGFRSDIIAGIDWVASQAGNAPVVANMSLGGSGSKSTFETCDASANTTAWGDSYHAAICNAAKLGVVFVVAAGNLGADAEASVPAAYDDAVITVTATDDQNAWPDWSNWGDGTTAPAPAPVAIAAPGVNILSTRLGGGTTFMDGTSMASPHVAGAVALYLEKEGLAADYTAFATVRDAVRNEAEATGSFSAGDNPHDEGFLDAENLATDEST